MSKILFLLASGALALSAQTPTGGPSLGFIFDARGHALRPVLGIPGAAMFGDKLTSQPPLSAGVVSAQHNAAVVYDGAWKAVMFGTAGISTTVALPDGLAANAKTAISQTGASAAFYDAANSALSVVANLASAPVLRAIDLSALPGGVNLFAVADDGSLLLSSPLDGGGEGLFWIGQDGSARQLATLQGAASIAIAKAGASAMVVDRAGNQILGIQDPGGNAAVTILASAADGVADPVGASLSDDGKQLWIANAGSHNVLGIDLTTRANVTLNCGFHLATMAPMADGTSFRLTHPGKGPVWILDAGPGKDPRIVFIPAIQSAEVAQ